MKRPQNDYMDSIIGHKFDVLDKGYLIVVDYAGDEEKIANSARVSYGDGTTKKNSDAGLIKNLVRNHHETPLEQVLITFEMKLPMFVLGQVIRHRIMSPNVMSARYSVMPDEFYVPSPDRMYKQHETNKQMSGDKLIDNMEAAQAGIKIAAMQCKSTYDALLDIGLVRELARGVLNQNQYTKMVCTFNLRSLMNFMYLRSADDAQWEIQQYANVLCEVVKNWLPNVWDAFEDYRLNSVTLSGKQASYFSSMLYGVTDGNRRQLIEDTCNSIAGNNMGWSKGEIAETIAKFERLVG